MTTRELTVIVTAHNRADLIEETLSSLADQEWDGDWDILLVDNASTDTTVQVLDRWAEKMPVPTRLMHADDRPSICYVRNAAVDATDATSVVFIDDDDVLGPGFVAGMGEALRVHEFVGATRELSLLNSDEEARWRGGQDRVERNHLFGVPIIPGGGCGCRRELWQRVGGNDEQVGYGAEDANLSMEVHLAGVEITFVDDAVYHVRHRTTSSSAYRQGVIFAEAHVVLAKRHGGDLEIDRDSLLHAVRAWGGLVRRLPTIRHRDLRVIWMWQLGRRIGRLSGSIKYRTWYP